MHRSSPSLSALIGLLEEQQARFEAFLTLLHEEQTAIKTISSTSLVAVNEAKLKVLEEIRLLEDKRGAAVARLAANWRVEPEGLTLRGIAERVGPIEAGTLLRLQDRLNKAILAVRDATAFNGGLIARSLVFLNQGLDVWRVRPREAARYSPSGAIEAAATRSAFVEQQG
jgi:flagellar biosynthesis/type III secretory pathway chaperone